MMNRTNRRAEEFDRALTAGAVPTDPAVAALVAVAGALAVLPQRAAPAFRDALRMQLMAEAASIGVAASAPAASVAAGASAASPATGLAKVFSHPAMQVATGGLATVVAATGVGVGASRSLPGDTLYGLKRTVESLQDRLAGGTLAEAGSVLEHAQTRVEEIVALLDRDGLGAVGAVEDTLNDLKAEIDTATADLLAQARAGSQAAYDKLDTTVEDLRAELTALRGNLPPELRDEVDAAMATLNSTATQLDALPRPGKPTVSPTPTHSPTPTTTKPTSPPPTSTSPSSTKPGTSTQPGTPTTTPPSITVTTPPIDVPLPTGSLTLPPTLP